MYSTVVTNEYGDTAAPFRVVVIPSPPPRPKQSDLAVTFSVASVAPSLHDKYETTGLVGRPHNMSRTGSLARDAGLGQSVTSASQTCSCQSRAACPGQVPVIDQPTMAKQLAHGLQGCSCNLVVLVAATTVS